MKKMDLHVTLHAEDGSFWAEVEELPGCFATGDTLDELSKSLSEAIGMCLPQPTEKRVPTLDLSFTKTISTQEFAFTV